MAQDQNRPSQDIAGVAGGGLESDRDQTSSSERVTRTVADERAPRKRADTLNDRPTAPDDDPTRTITSNDRE